MVTARFMFPGSSRLVIEVSAILIQAGGEMVVSTTGRTEDPYTIGDPVRIEVTDLVVGNRYRFRLSVSNSFGSAVSSVLSDQIIFVGE